MWPCALRMLLRLPLRRQPSALPAMLRPEDVLRPDGSKFGRISKAMLGLTETFEFFLEGGRQWSWRPGGLVWARFGHAVR